MPDVILGALDIRSIAYMNTLLKSRSSRNSLTLDIHGTPYVHCKSVWGIPCRRVIAALNTWHN